MKSLRFAFIGCGKIAPFHADVVKHLGHSIDSVVAREGSANIDSFAKRYGVKNKFYSVSSFLAHFCKFKDSIDCILVCTPWDVTEAVLEHLLPLNIPLMVEKPPVLSMAALEHIKKEYDTSNLFIAFNRRFYDFVPFLKEIIQKRLCMCVDILSAEPFEMIAKSHGEKIRRYMLHFYTSHIIDLMYYLFEDVEIKGVLNVGKNNSDSWVCELFSRKHSCPIQLKILMDCPQNSHFKIFFEKEVVEMRPFEKMILYDSLERKECGGRRIYMPAIKMQLETDDRFKPGFLNQTGYFIENFVYKKNSSREDIRQLEKVISFCDTLIKSKKNTGRQR